MEWFGWFGFPSTRNGWVGGSAVRTKDKTTVSTYTILTKLTQIAAVGKRSKAHTRTRTTLTT